MQDKRLKLLEGDRAQSQQVIGNVSKLVHEADPMLLAKVTGDHAISIIRQKQKRNVPVTDAKLNKYLDIAFSTIRGVKKLTAHTRLGDKNEHPIRKQATVPETPMQVISDGGVRTHLKADHILAKRFHVIVFCKSV